VGKPPFGARSLLPANADYKAQTPVLVAQRRPLGDCRSGCRLRWRLTVSHRGSELREPLIPRPCSAATKCRRISSRYRWAEGVEHKVVAELLACSGFNADIRTSQASTRHRGNLSSAIRLFILDFYRAQLKLQDRYKVIEKVLRSPIGSH
jgi:hypothetical protein